MKTQLFRGRVTVTLPVKKEVIKASKGRKAVSQAVATITSSIEGTPKSVEIVGGAWPISKAMELQLKRQCSQWIESNIVTGRSYETLCGETAAEVGKILFDALHTDKDWYVQVLDTIRAASKAHDPEATDGLWVASHLEAKWREKTGGESNPLLMGQGGVGFYDQLFKGIAGGLGGAFAGVSNALKSTPNANPGTIAAADTLAIASGMGTPAQQTAATYSLAETQNRARMGDPQAIAAMNNLQQANNLAAYQQQQQYQQQQYHPQYAPQPSGGGYRLPI